MARDPIVFAMANPVPEIQPEEVRDDVAIMATGRSDYPNQINNVLAFPGVFRGALDIRATTINEEMKLAAARAIAGVISDDELHADYVIPSVFNRDVAEAVAAAVAEAGTRSGVARRPVDPFVAGALIRQDGRVAGIAGATVTVIFADVEGSTALLERLGQARWMKALAEYEELLGSRLVTHGGTLVKALGDGHLLAFPSANAALRCAVDVQRALPLTTAPDLRVRMGMHTGEPVALEDDLHGRTVVKAARIADLAHGGEVLVSGIVRELAETDADLEEEIWFEESREVELRGLRGRHLVLAAHWQREDRGPIRVVIADDSAIVRDGVAALLRECGVHVAGLATDPESLYREIERHRPDVALVDIRMPPTGTNEGLVAAEHIGREYPEVGVLVLSQYLELAYALRLVEGQEARRGYLIKDRVGEIETLLDAVRRVANGGCVVDPEIVERLVTRGAGAGGPLAQLSESEREVLGLIAEGLSDEAIGERLQTTREAVQSEVDQIFDKLDLRDEGADRRVAAVLTYLRATAAG